MLAHTHGPGLLLMLGVRAECLAGKQEYQHQTPGDQSLLHNLMAAKQKDTGQPLTDTQICAQSFTFILAGKAHSRVWCSCLEVVLIGVADAWCPVCIQFALMLWALSMLQEVDQTGYQKQ